MKFYVYYLINPITNNVFYVGKGTKNRMYIHEKRAKRNIKSNNNTLLYDTICAILNKNLSIIYTKVFESDDEIAAYEFEFNEIRKIGLDKLTNIQDKRIYNGVSENVKKGLAKSDKWLETLKSEEYREKCRINNFGEKNPMFGSTWNIKQRTNIVEANRKPKTEEHKKKIGDGNRGKKMSESSKEKLSNSLKNSEAFQTKIKSDEYRKKQSINSSGSNNPNAKTYKFIDPNGKEYIVSGGFKKFCNAHNIGMAAMKRVQHSLSPAHKGWTVTEI